jgi:hypothetical protein
MVTLMLVLDLLSQICMIDMDGDRGKTVGYGVSWDRFRTVIFGSYFSFDVSSMH